MPSSGIYLRTKLEMANSLDTRFLEQSLQHRLGKSKRPHSEGPEGSSEQGAKGARSKRHTGEEYREVSEALLLLQTPCTEPLKRARQQDPPNQGCTAASDSHQRWRVSVFRE